MQIRVLGPLEVEIDGALVDLGGSRQRTVLSLLLAQHGVPLSTDRMVDEVWGESPPPSAPATLQTYISRLRALLGGEVITKRGAGYGWSLPLEDIDAVRFATADVAECREVLALWRGRPFADIPDTPILDEERRRLEELRLGLLERCLDLDLEAGRHREVVGELEALVAGNPLRERFVSQLMLALHRSNRQAEALRVYADFRRYLAEEMGLEPSPELAALEEGILLRRSDLSPRSAPQHNLPSARSTFVGRRAELAQVAEAISRHRLVTMTGAGGSGKTRLATEIAHAMLDRFPDGVWWVALGDISESTSLPDVVSAALGFRGVGGGLPTLGRSMRIADPIEALVGSLGTKSLLLVLDNCEHVIEAAASLVDTLLANDPNLSVLATSREPLRVEGEAVIPVPPLSVLETEGAGSEAVALFLDRARAASPGFVIERDDLALVAAICRRLDGMPLAIELAAAQVRAFGLEEIAARVDDRFRFLGAGRRTAPSRHQSLQAAVEWSYHLLTAHEQIAFVRLALFRGGFRIEAAEAVISGEPIPTDAVDGLLRELVEKSMVESEEIDGRSRRYRLLETLREFAERHLWQAPGGEEAVIRFANHYLHLAEDGNDHLHGPEALAWLARLRQELPNLRAAVDRSLEASRPELAIRMVGALGEFWVLQGFLGSERTWLDRALAADATPSDWRGRALAAASALAALAGEREVAARLAHEANDVYTYTGNRSGQAEALRLEAVAWMASPVRGLAQVTDLRRALEMFEEVNDTLGVARCHIDLAGLRFWAFDFRGMYEHGAEARRHFERLGDQLGIAQALVTEGRATFLLGGHDGLAKLTEALAVFREANARPAVAWTLFMLAEGMEEFDPAADSVFREAVTEFEAVGDRYGLLVGLGGWGWDARDHGRLGDAADYFGRSLRIARDLDEHGPTIWLFESIAGLATEVGLTGPAAQLFGFADSWRRRFDTELPTWDRPRHQRDYGRVRALLSPESLQHEIAHGGELGWEQAAAVAFDVTERVGADRGSPAPPAHGVGDP